MVVPNSEFGWVVTEANDNLEPQLAGASAMPRTVAAGAVGALVVLGLIGFGGFAMLPTSDLPTTQAQIRPPPATSAELSSNVVTVIPDDDLTGIKSAVAAMEVPKAQRPEIEKLVLSHERRIGWIVFVDSMDPDGDVVAVETGGWIQHVTLAKTWTPVPVLLSNNAPIEVTAVKDGAGGGITVALATRSGPVVLRILSPGEKIEVMP